jgi:tetratricopeptide (TPR) repeat protein
MPGSSDIDAICQRARESVRKRHFDEAIAIYEEALVIDSRDIRAHEGIATAAFLANDYSRAEEHFTRLSQLDPRRADPLVNLGAVHNRQGDYASAVKSLRLALSRNRKCAEAYYNLGIAYKGQNQLSMAVSAYKEAIRLAPQMAEAYQNLGNVFVEMGNLQQAITNFRRALEINPNFERARRGLEAAQQQSFEAAREMQPFGRLVDVDQLKAHATAIAGVGPARDMSEEERALDRAAVHRLSVLFEQRADELAKQLREHLGPSLLTLIHAVAQSEENRKLLVAQEHFVAALDGYRHANGPLLRSADELQAHEEDVRRNLKTA